MESVGKTPTPIFYICEKNIYSLQGKGPKRKRKIYKSLRCHKLIWSLNYGFTIKVTAFNALTKKTFQETKESLVPLFQWDQSAQQAAAYSENFFEKCSM
jgi:hypothetical protein